MSDDAAVKVTRRGDVVEIILSRPALLNRIDEPAHKELIAVFRALEFDATVRSVVLGAEAACFPPAATWRSFVCSTPIRSRGHA